MNDGISVVSLMDSAIQSQISVIQRMSELAQQSANGVYSTVQRKALSTEYVALRKELARIAETTALK